MGADEMTIPDMVWLASYPRSGNTLLRTILWQCFGLRSASVYQNDLGGNRALEDCVGHIEHDPGGKIVFPANTLPLIKTHRHPCDRKRAIYVIRDGRAAVTSLWDFYNGAFSLQDIIEGKTMFGTWSAHVRAWDPLHRPDTLLLRYEDMSTDLSRVLVRIREFLGCAILNTRIPDRSAIAGYEGRWVRSRGGRTSELPHAELERFMEINGETMIACGYAKAASEQSCRYRGKP